jgi:hypothetical protein
MDKATSSPKGLIAQAWAKSDEQLSNDQKNRRLNTMRRNAENQLSQYLTDKEKAEDNFSATLESSKKETVEFSTICDAYMAREEAALAYKEYVKLYTELFGETPLLVS